MVAIQGNHLLTQESETLYSTRIEVQVGLRTHRSGRRVTAVRGAASSALGFGPPIEHGEWVLCQVTT